MPGADDRAKSPGAGDAPPQRSAARSAALVAAVVAALVAVSLIGLGLGYFASLLNGR